MSKLMKQILDLARGSGSALDAMRGMFEATPPVMIELSLAERIIKSLKDRQAMKRKQMIEGAKSWAAAYGANAPDQQVVEPDVNPTPVPLAGVSFQVVPLSVEKGLMSGSMDAITAQFGSSTAALVAENGVDLSPYSRVIKITPTVEKVDLQNQIMALEALRKGWDFYADYGNVDLNHISPGYRDADGYQKKVTEGGYPYHPTVGPLALEIGRPIKGTFNTVDCSFLAFIYAKGEAQRPERSEAMAAEEKLGLPKAYDWFWDSLFTVPARRWRASVAGFSTPQRPGVVDHTDARFGRSGKTVVGWIVDWAWYSTAMTPTPMNSLVPQIEVIKDDPRPVIQA